VKTGCTPPVKRAVKTARGASAPSLASSATHADLLATEAQVISAVPPTTTDAVVVCKTTAEVENAPRTHGRGEVTTISLRAGPGHWLDEWVSR
jgi:hypothetical protein